MILPPGLPGNISAWSEPIILGPSPGSEAEFGSLSQDTGYKNLHNGVGSEQHGLV